MTVITKGLKKIANSWLAGRFTEDCRSEKDIGEFMGNYIPVLFMNHPARLAGLSTMSLPQSFYNDLIYVGLIYQYSCHHLPNINTL